MYEYWTPEEYSVLDKCVIKYVYYSDNARHLVCLPYSEENLHLMAKQLEISRYWFHKSPYMHYDIPKKRIKEIQLKSQAVSSKVILQICKGQFNAHSE